MSDISALKGCTALTYLNLAFTKVEDVSPLAGLRNLTEVVLTGSKVTDLSPVTRSGLTIFR